MYGAAGVFVSAQTGSGDPLAGDPLLLQVFAAIVIGGTVFGGGRGGCLGSVFGSYSLLLIINILLILNVSAYYATVVEGAILAVAALGVSLDQRSPIAQWLRRFGHRTRRPHGRLLHPTGATTGFPRPSDAALGRLPWWRRHAEDLRYAVPAYVCFVLVLIGTGFLYRGLSGGYVNSLLVLGSFLAVLSLGQGAVILTGGLDLSLPWTIGLCGILLAGIVQGHAFEAAVGCSAGAGDRGVDRPDQWPGHRAVRAAADRGDPGDGRYPAGRRDGLQQRHAERVRAARIGVADDGARLGRDAGIVAAGDLRDRRDPAVVANTVWQTSIRHWQQPAGGASVGRECWAYPGAGVCAEWSVFGHCRCAAGWFQRSGQSWDGRFVSAAVDRGGGGRRHADDWRARFVSWT